MGEWRPQSRKLRALAVAYGQPLEAIAKEWAASVLSSDEIAAEWQRKVRERLPEEQLEYGDYDVRRLWKRFGISPSERMTAGVV